MRNRFFEVREIEEIGGDVFVTGFDGDKEERIGAYTLIWLHQEGVEITVSDELEGETLNLVVSEIADFGDVYDVSKHVIMVTPEEGARYNEELIRSYQRKAPAIKRAESEGIDGYHYHIVPR